MNTTLHLNISKHLDCILIANSEIDRIEIKKNKKLEINIFD